MPYGRPSSVSNSTGPAASGAAVASRTALTTSANSAGASGDIVGRRERAAQLDDAVAIGLAPEPGRKQATRLGPVPRELTLGSRAQAEPGRELTLNAAR